MGHLIQPARCVAELSTEFKSHHVAEEKMDGSRYTLYIGYDPHERQELNALLSRRISVTDGMHVDRTGNVPHITAIKYEGLEGTILDGEVFLNDFPTTQSIIGSGPVTAIAKQEEQGLLGYHVWDVPFFRGKDIRGLPLEKRRLVLEEVVRRMNNPHIKVLEQFPAEQIEEKFKEIVNAGGEGLIVKDTRQGYGMGWSKMKKSYEVSCFISGYKEGKGKYEGQVGAIAISVYVDGKAVEIGFASGFDDSLRRKISDNQKEYLGKVVDIYAHEISKTNRLRHPTFFRIREDVNAKDCTLTKLKGDMKKKAKSSRWRAK